MKPDTSRFSSFCAMIAVFALVAGIAVTVEAAAQQLGMSADRIERVERQFLAPDFEPVSRRLEHPLIDLRDEFFLEEI